MFFLGFFVKYILFSIEDSFRYYFFGLLFIWVWGDGIVIFNRLCMFSGDFWYVFFVLVVFLVGGGSF